MKFPKVIFILMIPVIMLIVLTAVMTRRTVVAAGGIAAPVLKWEHGGCYNSWCERGWYSSPAVADLDNDGSPEVIGSPYSLFALNGEDGSEQWVVDPPGDRTWPGVVTADIDDNGDIEIIIAQGSGYVTVYDHQGVEVWSRRPESNELRGLSVFDLDADGTLEIVVTVTGNGENVYVYEHDGNLRTGTWPQMTDDTGYAWGVYNDNAAIGDIDNDGQGEIILPSDVHYINAYEADGAQIPAHAMYGGDGWGKVGIWESLEVELRGWGHCNGVRAESFRTNFADGPAVIADVNGDGVVEVVVTGNVYDCDAGYPPSQYIGVYIFNADRSRFNEDGFNWETVPVDTGAPLSEDYNVIESAMPNPVVADLDGDGNMEILFASYDGRLHAYWLDKSEHHNWPYNVAATGNGIRFASEPLVVDLDNNGQAEVIFTSWPQKGNNRVGKLHLLDYQGNVLHEIPLPNPYGSPDWNGAMAAPTIANIDADANMEIVLNTANSGFVAYDLPGSADAHILWGTGRGNYQRSGSFLVGDLSGSSMAASPVTPEANEMVMYTISLNNSGPLLASVLMTNTLPSEVTYFGNLSASSGTAVPTADGVNWSGSVSGGEVVTIQYAVTVNGDVTEPTAVLNEAIVNDGNGNIHHLSALIMVNGNSVYLPTVLKD